MAIITLFLCTCGHFFCLGCDGEETQGSVENISGFAAFLMDSEAYSEARSEDTYGISIPKTIPGRNYSVFL